MIGAKKEKQKMWIRSQDRAKLIDANEIHIELWADERSYVISDNFVLARYSSEQKALKVMDMIQNAITGTRFEFTDIVRDCDLAGIEIHNVFNMPQDSEVKV